MQKTLESRKYQLQRQIIEALKSKDSDLYSLLRSQWAHRFGVESLEELKNLDLEKENQRLKKEIDSLKEQLDNLVNSSSVHVRRDLDALD